MKMDVTRMVGELSPSEKDGDGALEAAPYQGRGAADERRSEGRLSTAISTCSRYVERGLAAISTPGRRRE